MSLTRRFYNNKKSMTDVDSNSTMFSGYRWYFRVSCQLYQLRGLLKLKCFFVGELTQPISFHYWQPQPLPSGFSGPLLFLLSKMLLIISSMSNSQNSMIDSHSNSFFSRNKLTSCKSWSCVNTLGLTKIFNNAPCSVESLSWTKDFNYNISITIINVFISKVYCISIS